MRTGKPYLRRRSRTEQEGLCKEKWANLGCEFVKEAIALLGIARQENNLWVAGTDGGAEREPIPQLPCPGFSAILTPAVAKTYVVTFRSHNGDRPSKFI